MRFGLVAVLLVALAACGDDSGEWWADPPDGTRWVGSGGVVVAVPDWWTTGETQCNTPVETTVYADQSAQVDCADTSQLSAVNEVSALAVLDGSGGYGELQVRAMLPTGDVLELPGCEEWFEGVCRRLFTLPGSDPVFAVTIADDGDGDYEEIRDSARELPAGVTTVPLATADGWTPSWGESPQAVEELRAAIEDAGLRVEVETAEPSDGGDVADLPTGSLLDVDPVLGSVVEEGSLVTITVM